MAGLRCWGSRCWGSGSRCCGCAWLWGWLSADIMMVGRTNFCFSFRIYIDLDKIITIIISPASRDHKPRVVEMNTTIGRFNNASKEDKTTQEEKGGKGSGKGQNKNPTRRRTGLGDSLNNEQSDRVTRALSTSVWPTIRYAGRSCPNAAPSIIG